MYDFIKGSGQSIGDLQAQLDFLWHEIQGYATVMNVLKTSNSIRQASDIVLTRYEQPADQTVSSQVRREGYGQTQYDKFSGQHVATPIELYNVRVNVDKLFVRIGPGTNYADSGTITDRGVYTVLEVATGDGAVLWGKIRAGQNGAQSGWFALDHTTRVA